MRIAAMVLGLLGGLVALSQGVLALTAVGSDPQYASRLWAAWLALAAGIVGAGASVLALRRPRLAAIILFLCALVGPGSILLFYINTFYLLAAPLWLLAAVAALAAPGSATVAAAEPPAA